MNSASLGVRATLPPIGFLRIPPAAIPATLPPPEDHPTLAHPFTISKYWYNALLSANVPITIALVYASIVTFLNSVNARRKYRPWRFSQTGLFKLMVIIHNIFLSLYSLWTFLGMWNALRLSLVSPRSEHGLAATVDSLCKIHGPRGIGSAATFNENTTAWNIANKAFHLGADGLGPDSTDVGRIWNEGLAFYGWLFYISKFYEVIDTLIILAKGKKSSLLQTYHHAGAMMAMWAGIRYMSPPIWMFVLVNSFIHFVMYAFYLCSAIQVRVPVWFKRTLTTLQITQFVVGASYAFAHLFIKYQSPTSVPFLYHAGSIASEIPADASSVASSAIATASAGAASWLKKAALRAAGREGLAENVLNEQGQTFGIDAVHAAKDFYAREETRYRDELQWVHCLDTSGQTFAILFNVIYLAPLTWLFAQFFIKAYLQRAERRRSSTASQKAYMAGQSGRDALRGVGRRLSQAFEDSQMGIEEVGDDGVLIDGAKIKKAMKEDAKYIEEYTKAAALIAEKKARETLAEAKEKAQQGLDEVRSTTQEQDNKVENSKESADKQKEKAADALDELADRVKSEPAVGDTISSDTKADTVPDDNKDAQSEPREKESANEGSAEDEDKSKDTNLAAEESKTSEDKPRSASEFQTNDNVEQVVKNNQESEDEQEAETNIEPEKTDVVEENTEPSEETAEEETVQDTFAVKESGVAQKGESDTEEVPNPEPQPAAESTEKSLEEFVEKSAQDKLDEPDGESSDPTLPDVIEDTTNMSEDKAIEETSKPSADELNEESNESPSADRETDLEIEDRPTVSDEPVTSEDQAIPDPTLADEAQPSEEKQNEEASTEENEESKETPAETENQSAHAERSSPTVEAGEAEADAEAQQSPDQGPTVKDEKPAEGQQDSSAEEPVEDNTPSVKDEDRTNDEPLPVPETAEDDKAASAEETAEDIDKEPANESNGPPDEQISNEESVTHIDNESNQDKVSAPAEDAVESQEKNGKVGESPAQDERSTEEHTPSEQPDLAEADEGFKDEDKPDQPAEAPSNEAESSGPDTNQADDAAEEADSSPTNNTETSEGKLDDEPEIIEKSDAEPPVEDAIVDEKSDADEQTQESTTNGTHDIKDDATTADSQPVVNGDAVAKEAAENGEKGDVGTVKASGKPAEEIEEKEADQKTSKDAEEVEKQTDGA